MSQWHSLLPVLLLETLKKLMAILKVFLTSTTTTKRCNISEIKSVRWVNDATTCQIIHISKFKSARNVHSSSLLFILLIFAVDLINKLYEIASRDRSEHDHVTFFLAFGRWLKYVHDSIDSQCQWLSADYSIDEWSIYLESLITGCLDLNLDELH